MKLKEIVRTVAPSIATALGGPICNAATTTRGTYRDGRRFGATPAIGASACN